MQVIVWLPSLTFSPTRISETALAWESLETPHRILPSHKHAIKNCYIFFEPWIKLVLEELKNLKKIFRDWALIFCKLNLGVAKTVIIIRWKTCHTLLLMCNLVAHLIGHYRKHQNCTSFCCKEYWRRVYYAGRLIYLQVTLPPPAAIDGCGGLPGRQERVEGFAEGQEAVVEAPHAFK